jgi:hypothetical protein
VHNIILSFDNYYKHNICTSYIETSFNGEIGRFFCITEIPFFTNLNDHLAYHLAETKTKAGLKTTVPPISEGSLLQNMLLSKQENKGTKQTHLKTNKQENSKMKN